jgi:hypothetical protein
VFTDARYKVHKFTHLRDRALQRKPTDYGGPKLLPIEVPDEDIVMGSEPQSSAQPMDHNSASGDDPFSDDYGISGARREEVNPFSSDQAMFKLLTSHKFSPADLPHPPLPSIPGSGEMAGSPQPTSSDQDSGQLSVSSQLSLDIGFEDSGLDPASTGCPSLPEQLQEKFLKGYHSGGGLQSNESSHDYSLLAPTAKHLSEHDLDICLAYSFMVQARLTNRESQKLPQAFRGSNLVSPEHVQARVQFLAGVEPELYDCCPGANACMCFTGEHCDLTKCLVCDEPRFNSQGHPRRRFTYIPLIPRLKAAATSQSFARAMQYRAEYNHKAGTIGDVFDGDNYQHLQNSYIKIHGEELRDATGKLQGTKYFEDHRDVALGLSTDGFTVHGRTFWPLIIFLYNLPPTIRFLLENIFALGVIPGKPVLINTFLWPLLQELQRLASGITAFDILSYQNFVLRAFLILIFGDIPAIAMLMLMKGHNGICPCRACPILATPLRRGTRVTYYVLSTFGDDAEWRELRDHQRMIQQAQEVEDAATKDQAEALAKKSGIKGKSAFFTVDSILFSSSFPYDFMHLVWEGVIKTLIQLWTNEDFKGLDEGKEEYQIDPRNWKQIGSETAKSSKTIPSSFGPHLPNIADSLSNISADMWSFWCLFVGPVVLQNRFHHPKYFNHFVALVSLINICLQRRISSGEVDKLERGFAKWVEGYQMWVFQTIFFTTTHSLQGYTTKMIPSGFLSALFHYMPFSTLLKVSDTVDQSGATGHFQWKGMVDMKSNQGSPASGSHIPAWTNISCEKHACTSWASSMTFQTSWHWSLRKDLIPSSKNVSIYYFQSDPFSFYSDPTCEFSSPKAITLGSRLQKSIEEALASRFSVTKKVIQRLLKSVEVEVGQWGRVRVTDPDTDDTIWAADLRPTSEDQREASYVRVSDHNILFG